MTTPNRVRVCAETLAARGGSLNERIDRVDVRGTPDTSLRRELAFIARAWCDEGYGAFEAIDVLGETVAIPDLEMSEGELRVSFIKMPTASNYFFLSARGLAALLADHENAARARCVFIAEEFAPFRTVQCAFAPWVSMELEVPTDSDPALPSPRRIVRDQLAIVPLSVGPLILSLPPLTPRGNGTSSERAAPPNAEGAAMEAAVEGGTTEKDVGERDVAETSAGQTCKVFQAWRNAALPLLLISLADEVWRQEDETHVALTGPRKRKLPAKLDQIDAERDFKIITDAADWIFNSGRDAETRHTLFAYELAREWPEGVPFAAAFSDRAPGALEAAKSAFRMHVRDASKETLKSLQELRKTLADDVTRVVTQTRELTSTLWRDLLVIIAALLGRFTLLASSDNDQATFADALLIGLAIYLAFSLGIVIFTNGRFIALFRKIQGQWKTKLYGFVDPEDFKLLATEPLAEAQKVYTSTRSAAILAYGLAILALIFMASQNPTLAGINGTNGDGAATAAASNETPSANPIASGNAVPDSENSISPPELSGSASGSVAINEKKETSTVP